MSNRTERPTPRRLREARRRGEIATSRDLTAAGALAGAILALTATAAPTTRLLAEAIRSGIARAVDPATAPWPATLAAIRLLLRVSFAPLAGAMTGAVLVGSLQAGGLFTLEAIRFRWERLDPVQASGRWASPARFGSLAWSVAKALVLLVTGAHFARSRLEALPDLTRLGAAQVTVVLGRLALGVGAPLAAVAAVFGAIDWALAARRRDAGLRMTRDEVRREQREDQGDPQHRAERRRVHRALASAPPLRDAACVVVNPTHVAIALHHDRARRDAPTVVAKGQGAAAHHLRRAARRAGVPVVENVPLARALYRLADIGEEIPEELYEAAAVVLAELYRSRGVVA